jgi:hypothetical protein
VVRSVEEALRILLEFLAPAKAQGHLILLALEVRWGAEADLGWQPQTPHRRIGRIKHIFASAPGAALPAALWHHSVCIAYTLQCL